MTLEINDLQKEVDGYVKLINIANNEHDFEKLAEYQQGLAKLTKIMLSLKKITLCPNCHQLMNDYVNNPHHKLECPACHTIKDKLELCPNCYGVMSFSRYCGVMVCNCCDYHKGLGQCYCGWNMRAGERLEDDVGEYTYDGETWVGDY